MSSATTVARSAPAMPVYGRGLALALLGALLWSLSGILVRLIDGAGSWQIVFYRSVTMAATLMVILVVRGAGHPPLRLRRDALLAAAALTGASTLFILSLAHVTVANALFMSGIAPFVTALLALAWLGERVTPRTWAAMVLAAVGVVVMVWNGLGFDNLTGNLLALGSAICFAFVAIFLRRGRQSDMTPTVLWSGLFTAMLSGSVLAAGGGAAAFAVGPHDLALCAVMGSVQLGLGTICYAVAARHLPAAPLQLLALSELVLSPLWVWLAVGEVPTTATLAGGALIMGATALQATDAFRGAGRPAPAVPDPAAGH